jgi:hypothetical protein
MNPRAQRRGGARPQPQTHARAQLRAASGHVHPVRLASRAIVDADSRASVAVMPMQRERSVADDVYTSPSIAAQLHDARSVKALASALATASTTSSAARRHAAEKRGSLFTLCEAGGSADRRGVQATRCVIERAVERAKTQRTRFVEASKCVHFQESSGSRAWCVAPRSVLKLC